MNNTTTDHTDTSFACRGCPDDEVLLAYLLATLDHDELGRITAHISACDGCVDNLTAMQHRLAIAAEVPLPVPAAITARVQDRSRRPAPITHLASVERMPAKRSIREVLDAWLRLPILVPSSVALGVLLFVAAHTWVTPETARTLTRSVDIQQSLRVNVPEVEVRAAPDAHAPVVGTLKRGQVVTVDVQQHEWCRVAVAAGTKGWVDCGVFR